MRKRFSHSMKNNRTTIEGLYHICPSMSVIPPREFRSGRWERLNFYDPPRWQREEQNERKNNKKKEALISLWVDLKGCIRNCQFFTEREKKKQKNKVEHF